MARLVDPRSRAFHGVLQRAAQVMVGVLTPHGPHVTPELFTLAGGRIWCFTAVTTLKARLLERGAPVGVAATSDAGRCAVARGRAVVLDVAHPLRVARHLDAGLAMPVAAGRFAARNAAELTGALRDLVAGELGWPVPPRRVLLCIEPQVSALLDDDGVPERASGRTPGSARTSRRRASPSSDVRLIASVPEQVRALAGDGPAFVGWTTTSGEPLVLPGFWQAGDRRAVVRTSLLEVLDGSTTSRASVTRDGWTGYGPSGKHGVMLRGDGVASPRGERTELAIDIDAVAHWHGVKTGHIRGEAR